MEREHTMLTHNGEGPVKVRHSRIKAVLYLINLFYFIFFIYLILKCYTMVWDPEVELQVIACRRQQFPSLTCIGNDLFFESSDHIKNNSFQTKAF